LSRRCFYDSRLSRGTVCGSTIIGLGWDLDRDTFCGCGGSLSSRDICLDGTTIRRLANIDLTVTVGSKSLDDDVVEITIILDESGLRSAFTSLEEVSGMGDVVKICVFVVAVGREEVVVGIDGFTSRKTSRTG
jgi:hypothetical protein